MRKKWICILLALAFALSLAACGAEEDLEEPGDAVFRRDVQEYVSEILDHTATISDFEKLDSEIADGILTVNCAVCFSGENGAYEGTFTLVYSQNDQEWLLEKCRVALDTPAPQTQPEETEETEPAQTVPESEAETTAPSDGECDHSYITTKIAPTTTSRGYYNHKCKYCGYTFNDNFVPALTTDDTGETYPAEGGETAPVYPEEDGITDPEYPGATNAPAVEETYPQSSEAAGGDYQEAADPEVYETVGG